MGPSENLRLSKDVRRDLTPYLPKHNPLPTSSHLGPVEKPFVTITYAASLDSSIAIAPNRQTVISGPESKAMTHYLRFVHDAIVVGVNTAITDDPTLNSRIRDAEKYGLDSQPRPVVLDTQGRWDAHKRCKMVAAALQGTGKPPWVFVHVSYLDKIPRARRDLIEDCGGAYIGFEDRDSLIAALGSRGIRSVMIEGGASVINHFFDHHIERISSVIITLAPVMFGQGGVKVLPKDSGESVAVSFDDVRWVPLGKDMIMCGFPVHDGRSAIPPVDVSTSLQNGHINEPAVYDQATPVASKSRKTGEPCFACGEIGHIKRDCPLAQRNAVGAAPPDTQTRVDLDESVSGTPAPDDPKNEQTPQALPVSAGATQASAPTLQPAWNESSGYSVKQPVEQPVDKTPMAREASVPEQPPQPTLRTNQPQPLSWADDTPVSEQPPPTPPWMKKQAQEARASADAVSAQTVPDLPEDDHESSVMPTEAPEPAAQASVFVPKPSKWASEEPDVQQSSGFVKTSGHAPSESNSTADVFTSKASRRTSKDQTPRGDTNAANPSSRASPGSSDAGRRKYDGLSDDILKPGAPGSPFSYQPSKYAADPDPPPSSTTSSHSRGGKHAILRQSRTSPTSGYPDDEHNQGNYNDSRHFAGRGRPDRSRARGARGGRGRYQWESDAPGSHYDADQRFNGRGRGNSRFVDDERPRRGKFPPRGGRQHTYEDHNSGPPPSYPPSHRQQQHQQGNHRESFSGGGDENNGAQDSWADNTQTESKPSWDQPVSNAWGAPATDVW